MNKEISKSSSNHIFVFIFNILLVSSLSQVNSDLYLPSLPSMAKNLSVDINWIQFTIAIYMAGFSLSQIVYGPWSDAVGRRSPLLTGLFINFIGSLICWLSPNIYLIFLGRFMQGLGVGAGFSLGRSLLRDVFENEKLAIYNSYLAVSTVVMLTTAPIIGGYIQQYVGWRYNFLFLSIYGLFIFYFSYLNIPETSRFHHKDNSKIKVVLANVKILIKSPIFLRFSMCSALTYAGILAWVTEAPIVLQEKIGLNPVQFGWVYIFFGIGFAAGGLLNTRCITRFGINRMITTGIFCQLCSGLIMLSFYLFGYINTYVVVAPILLFMMGSSIVFPNASAGALTPFPKISGTAAALFCFIQISAGTLSSSIVAAFDAKSQLPIAMAFVIIALLSMLNFRRGS